MTRYYASQLARFISVDPLKDDYPYYTSYQYAGNKPITFIDLDGLEEADPELIRSKQLQLMLLRMKKSVEKKKPNKKPAESLKEPLVQKSDNTKVSVLDKKMQYIQSQVNKKVAFEQQKKEFSKGNFSLLNAPDISKTGTIKATSLQHPGVDDQSFRMATQDPVFQASTVSLFTTGTVAIAGEITATEAFKKVFQTKIEKVAAGIVKDAFGQYVVNGGDISEIDWANAIASGFVKNQVLKNLISSAVDFDANGIDTSKYEDSEGIEKLGQEFLIRQLADSIFKSYISKMGSDLPKGFNAEAVLDIVKKELRNYTNKGIDKTQEVINRNTNEQQKK